MKRLVAGLSVFLLFLLSVDCAYGKDVAIRFLYMNDFHGYAEPHRPVGSKESAGGIAYLASRVRELRKEAPSVLLAAGDMIQGHNWANFSRGRSVIEVLNALNVDAMVVGNHEFDFGQEALKQRMAEAKFPFLGANVEGMAGLKPYVITEIEGVTVGIVGVVTEDVSTTTHPKNVSGLRFLSPLASVERYLSALKGRAQIVVLLSHVGYPVDRMIAERIGGIDVIIGGHSHTRIEKPVKVGDTIILQAWEHAKALGVLDLVVRDGKILSFDGRLEDIKPEKGREDQRVAAIVEGHAQQMSALLSEPVGEAEVDLDGLRGNVRKRETNLGNLIADILREKAKAEVAVINGGSIRAGMTKGIIRMKDIYQTLPFDNFVIAMKLTGRQVRETLEHGVSGREKEEGRFLQVSGLSFTYHPEAEPGARIRDISVGGRPIDGDAEYVVATTDFLAAGGDGFTAFGEAMKGTGDVSPGPRKVVFVDSSSWLRDEVAAYIRERGRVAPRVEGRIREVGP